jgi:hypothetical protein
MKRLLFALPLLFAGIAFAYTTTPNMSLKTPAPGDTDYPTSISDSFTLIDAHDHSSGKGVQIPAGGIAGGAVTTAKINDLAVTTGKLADNAVTRAKLAAVGHQISDSSGTASTSSTSYGDVTNLSVTITTTGRPVVLALIPDGSASEAYLGSVHASAAMAECLYRILEDASDIAVFSFRGDVSAMTVVLAVPPGSVYLVHPTSAGTYTYKIQAKVGPTATGTPACRTYNVKLVAYEL